MWKIWKIGRNIFYLRRINAEAHKKWWIRADGTATLLAGSCEPRTHSGAGTDREGRTNRWRWSPCRHLVDPRWLQLSSSQWTSSFNSACRRKKHSLFREYIDVTRSTHTDLDVLQEKRINDYWNVDSCRNLSDSWTGFSKFTRLKEKKPSTRIHVVRKENDKNSHDDQTQIMVCKYRRELVTPLRIEKNKNWQQRNWSSTMLEKWKDFTLLIQMSENLRKFFKRKKKTWKACHQIARRICLRSPKFASEKNSKTVYGWKVDLMNLRDSEQNLRSPKTMRIMAGKDLLR